MKGNTTLIVGFLLKQKQNKKTKDRKFSLNKGIVLSGSFYNIRGLEYIIKRDKYTYVYTFRSMQLEEILNSWNKRKERVIFPPIRFDVTIDSSLF